MEKVPLLVLSLLFSAIAYRAESSGGALGTLEDSPLGVRLANVPVSYFGYIRKMVWPTDLTVFYPHPGDHLAVWQVMGAAFLVLGLTVAALLAARRRPYIGVGWLWYTGTLVPVIGIVQVGGHAMADRYTYIPLVGLFIILAWGIPDLVNGRMGEWANGRQTTSRSAMNHQPSTIDHSAICHQPSLCPPFSLSPILPFIILAALGTCAYIQAGYWDTSVKLFRHAIAVTRNNHIAQNNLAVGLKWQGRLDDAIAHYRRALAIWPGYPDAQSNLGVALIEMGLGDEALKVYGSAIRSNPREAALYYNYAVALTQLRKLDEAVSQYRKAVGLRPDYVSAQMNLGVLLARLGRHQEAIAHLAAAVKAQPEYARAHYNLAAELYNIGEYSRALRELDLAAKHGMRIPPEMRQSAEEALRKE